MPGPRHRANQLETLSDAFAAALQSLGVRKGDRVAFAPAQLPAVHDRRACGAWKLGAIVAPLNPTYTESELEGPLRDNGVETVVTLTRFYDRVKRVQPRTPVSRVIATNIKEYFPTVLRILFTLVRERKEGDRVQLATGDHAFAALLAAHRGRSPKREAVGPDDPAVLLMSGGTTGTPKGVLGTHSAYVISGLQIQLHARGARPRRQRDSAAAADVPCLCQRRRPGARLHHRNAVSLVPNPRDLPDVLATINRVKPAFFNGVPTLYIAMLNHPDVPAGKIDFKSIKVCFSGAAALMADTKHRFETLTGGRIVEGYSLTEAMMALCVNPVKGADKLGSVGMPLPDVHVTIFDADDGIREMPFGEVGEICFAAPQLMIGFWKRPEETRGVLRDHVGVDGTRQYRTPAISATWTTMATSSSSIARKI